MRARLVVVKNVLAILAVAGAYDLIVWDAFGLTAALWALPLLAVLVAAGCLVLVVGITRGQ